jgi:hypothetical protein
MPLEGLELWMIMAAILAQEFNPATLTQCQKLREKILIPKRLKRNLMTNPVKRKYSMGNLMIRRA